MKMNDDARFIAGIRSALDAGIDELDQDTLNRLAAARAKAQTPRRKLRYGWLPAGGAVLASVLVAALWLGQPGVVPVPAVEGVTELEILLGQDGMSLLQEIEFYAWLEDDEGYAG